MQKIIVLLSLFLATGQTQTMQREQQVSPGTVHDSDSDSDWDDLDEPSTLTKEQRAALPGLPTFANTGSQTDERRLIPKDRFPNQSPQYLDEQDDENRDKPTDERALALLQDARKTGYTYTDLARLQDIVTAGLAGFALVHPTSKINFPSYAAVYAFFCAALGGCAFFNGLVSQERKKMFGQYFPFNDRISTTVAASIAGLLTCKYFPPTPGSTMSTRALDYGTSLLVGGSFGASALALLQWAKLPSSAPTSGADKPLALKSSSSK